jgi:hypothetical protein
MDTLERCGINDRVIDIPDYYSITSCTMLSSPGFLLIWLNLAAIPVHTTFGVATIDTQFQPQIPMKFTHVYDCYPHS